MTTFAEYIDSLPRETACKVGAIILALPLMNTDEEKRTFLFRYSQEILEKVPTAARLLRKQMEVQNEKVV
jgi:1,4-dihydroxy-2-naphthoyl-CoA synthase